jgi:YidC/Oxa1 family membrane protein insertase
MEKRVLLAVTLSFLVLAAYQYFFVKPTPREQQRPTTATAPAAPGATAPGTPPAAGTGAQASSPGSPAVVQPAEPIADVQPLVADIEERDVVVDTPKVRAVFSTRGAQLKSWQLKDYRADDGSRSVDLVPANVPATEPLGFALGAADEALSARLRSALFRPSATALDASQGQKTLAFEYQDAAGLAVRKEFEFEANGQPYLVAFSAEVRNNGQPVPVTVASGPGLVDTDRGASSGSFFSPSYYQKPQAIFQQDTKVSRLDGSSLLQTPTYQGRFRYIGSDDHYFLSVLVPGERDVRVDYRTFSLVTGLTPRTLITYTASQQSPWQKAVFYLGPKQFDVLAASDKELVRTIHFGIFDWLVVPLLRALNAINRYVGNYGWSIITLTILINLAMWPLRHKSMVSMRKMQALQPQIKALQDRYADLKMTDPARQKMNTEMMNLYREKGVNPASGCVPMLLTFPVLFAFYALLAQAIELRGAPFFGWIHDLSVKDPLFITPLLMGGTMFWQQRMTPSTADPTQQKVMMFMPIMFTFMFLWAPSGLVVYWFVSNLFAIGQQYLTNRMIGAPPAATPKARAANA